jgi:hypothetical protein
MKLPELGSDGGTVALCERCGEEIAVANDLDLAGDVDPTSGHGRRQPSLADRDALADFHAALPAPRRCRLQRSHPRGAPWPDAFIKRRSVPLTTM